MTKKLVASNLYLIAIFLVFVHIVWLFDGHEVLLLPQWFIHRLATLKNDVFETLLLTDFMIIRDVDAFWHRLTGKTDHVETGEIRGNESVLLKGLVPW